MCAFQFNLHFITIQSIKQPLLKITFRSSNSQNRESQFKLCRGKKRRNLKNDSENRESGEVRIDENERRLEFEGIIRHIIRFTSTRFLLVNCSSSRNASSTAKKEGDGEKEQLLSVKNARGYELNEHSLIFEAEFTSESLWLLLLGLTFYVITTVMIWPLRKHSTSRELLFALLHYPDGQVCQEQIMPSVSYHCR